jgi:hypothetical protein
VSVTKELFTITYNFFKIPATDINLKQELKQCFQDINQMNIDKPKAKSQR